MVGHIYQVAMPDKGMSGPIWMESKARFSRASQNDMQCKLISCVFLECSI